MRRAGPRTAAAVLLALAACSPATAPAPDRAGPGSPRPTPAAATTPPPATEEPSPDPFALARSYEAPDPGELARRLEAAETAIRSPATPPSSIAAAGRVQQASYRQLVARPDWRDGVIEQLPPPLRAAAGANIEAGADLRALTAPRTELPDWEIVDAPEADELRSHYAEAESSFGVGWDILAAIHLVETRMGRIRGTSTAGARGPMQFLPTTWARWGQGDIEDARDSILAAGRFLHGHGAAQDISGALYRYNPSRHYVRAIELYAAQMRTDERAFYGYYHWQVYYRTTVGDALLEVGWTKRTD